MTKIVLTENEFELLKRLPDCVDLDLRFSVINQFNGIYQIYGYWEHQHAVSMGYVSNRELNDCGMNIHKEDIGLFNSLVEKKLIKHYKKFDNYIRTKRKFTVDADAE